MGGPYHSSPAIAFQNGKVILTLHKRLSEPFHFESYDSLRQHEQILHKHRQRGDGVAACLKLQGL